MKISKLIKANLSKNLNILIIGLICLLPVVWELYNSKDLFLTYFFLYMALFVFANWIPDRGAGTVVRTVLQFPGIILILYIPLYESFLMLTLAFIGPFVFPAVFFMYFPEAIGYDLTFSVKLFIILSFGATFITLFGERLIKKINDKYNRDKSEVRKESQYNLTIGIVNEERIRFFIYVGFLIYLLVYSIANLRGTKLFDIPNCDQSVFYSFVMYIAVDRVISNRHLMKFKPSTFISKLIITWEARGYFRDHDK